MTQFVPASDKKEKQKTNTDALKRDYCLFMDGSKYNRNIACNLHDNAYGIKGGGSEADRIKADKALFDHMKQNKDPLAYIAYAGVRFYGWLFFNYQRKMLWSGQLLKRIFPKLSLNSRINRVTPKIYHALFAGVDEVGRGCLAGPVTVCSLLLKSDYLNPVLNDSKKLTEKKREALFEPILEISDYKIISLDATEIDRLNIFQATMKAMKLSLEELNPVGAYIDGNKCPETIIPCHAVIGGDGIVAQISAASIIAKVTRDRYMHQLDAEYPEYGFAQHKGYGTKQHLEAIQKYGITPYHRHSFAPVRQMSLVF